MLHVRSVPAWPSDSRHYVALATIDASNIVAADEVVWGNLIGFKS
jgi:hypothetical protein